MRSLLTYPTSTRDLVSLALDWPFSVTAKFMYPKSCNNRTMERVVGPASSGKIRCSLAHVRPPAGLSSSFFGNVFSPPFQRREF